MKLEAAVIQGDGVGPEMMELNGTGMIYGSKRVICLPFEQNNILVGGCCAISMRMQ